MKYLIYFQPRCGSTYIASWLNDSQRNFVNGFEIITPRAAKDYSLVNEVELLRFDPAVKREVLRRYFESNTGHDIVGCKVAPYQVRDDLPGFFQYSLQICDRLIFMYRQDPVQAALSQLWALNRYRSGEGAFLRLDDQDSSELATVDKREFEYFVISSILERDTVLSLSKLKPNSLVISYEQFFDHVDERFLEILEHLGAREYKNLAKPNLKKVRDSSPLKFVKNPDEVVAWAKDLGYRLSA